MARLSIDKQFDEAIRELDGLTDKARNAAVRAINKTLGNVKTEAVRLIGEKRKVSRKAIRAALKISTARKNKLSGSIQGSNKPISLREYGARRNTKKRGVSVNVTGSRKEVTFNGNKAFVIDKFGGHVFTRDSNTRLPISKRYGPSIESAVLNEAIASALLSHGEESLRKRFIEEVRFERIRMERAR